MANDAIMWIIFTLIILALIIALFAWFYKRATREVSLVKTGIGGRKVVMDGGTIAIPYFHEVSRVNMQTLRLEVQRINEAALITKDRMRVDVGVEFYVSVIPNEDGIARAVQTLGNRTFHADQLRELIQGKLVDALRSVAARMTMDELHENRGVFVADVREGLVDSLSHNGLELDSVSLTSLDQTPFDKLDENNVFNAVGMRKLAEVVAKSKKERAEIDSNAEVSVHRAAMEATKRKLQISLEEQEAEIAQIQEIETLKAAQLAEVAGRKAEGERAAAQARIQMEQEIRTADIARESMIREAEISKEKKLEEIEILHQQEIEIAQHESQIILAQKSQEESKAQVMADVAKAEAVKAAEGISTAQQITEAERKKAIALLAAKQEAETSGTRQTLAAQAEKEIAADLAKAKIEEAEAKKKGMMAEAEGRRALIDAENALSERMVEMKTDLARLETLPKIVAEMVKPAEKIDTIKIHQLSGLGTGQITESSEASNKPVVNQVLDSVMEMAVQLPALKKIGEEISMSFDGGIAEPTAQVKDTVYQQLSQSRHKTGAQPNVLMIVTLDTKEQEAKYVRNCLEEAGLTVHHLDASIRRLVDGGAEIGPKQVAAAAGKTIEEVRAIGHEGKCQAVMIEGATKCAHELDDRIGLSGIIGVGGSMGTSLGTAVMRSFPFGLPKVMVSTMASGFTQGFVGTKDISMFHSVADISGLNTIIGTAFRNGSLALAGMAHEYKPVKVGEKPLIALSTLGTTEKCSVRIRKALEVKGYEVIVFHTTGTGGQAMDEIVEEQDVSVVINLSIVEIGDFLHGGLCSAGPDRCKASLKKGVPTIFAPGNIDFVIAGPIDDAKVRFPNKRYHIHNPALTAVRTEEKEMKAIAEHMSGLIKEAKGPVTFFVPLQGFSSHDSPEGHLLDLTMPPLFLQHLKNSKPEKASVIDLDCHINDEEFADRIIKQVIEYCE